MYKKGNYNEKLSKVIAMSNNYQHHYDNLNKIRPVVDVNDHKHIKKTQELSNQKHRYAQNVRKYQLGRL